MILLANPIFVLVVRGKMHSQWLSQRVRQRYILKIPAKKARKSPCTTPVWLCFSLSLDLTSLLYLGNWLWLPTYLIAHALQTLDELALHLGTVSLMEELLPLFLIFLPGFHHVIIDHQNIMAYC
jgi:hypothetical protein